MRKRRYAIKRVCSVVLTVPLLSGCQWGGNRGEGAPVLDTTGKAESAGAAMLSGNLPESDGELEITGFQAESYEPADWMQGGFQMPQVWQGYRESVCVNTYVLDIPSQYPSCLLRRDVLRERVVLSDEDGKYETDQLTGISLPLKKDGGSYVEDYLVFMDSCT